MDKIILTEILRYAPKNTVLWCTIFGEVKLVAVEFGTYPELPIRVIRSDNDTPVNLDKFGRLYPNYPDGECVLFPSKDCRDWTAFKADWMDHKVFKPLQPVLVLENEFYSDGRSQVMNWCLDIYSHYFDGNHFCVNAKNVFDTDILPYEGNEDKLGKRLEQ